MVFLIEATWFAVWRSRLLALTSRCTYCNTWASECMCVHTLHIFTEFTRLCRTVHQIRYVSFYILPAWGNCELYKGSGRWLAVCDLCLWYICYNERKLVFWHVCWIILTGELLFLLVTMPSGSMSADALHSFLCGFLCCWLKILIVMLAGNPSNLWPRSERRRQGAGDRKGYECLRNSGCAIDSAPLGAGHWRCFNSMPVSKHAHPMN